MTAHPFLLGYVAIGTLHFFWHTGRLNIKGLMTTFSADSSLWKLYLYLVAAWLICVALWPMSFFFETRDEESQSKKESTDSASAAPSHREDQFFDQMNH